MSADEESNLLLQSSTEIFYDAIAIEESPATTHTISYKYSRDDFKFAGCILLGTLIYLLPPPKGLTPSASDTLAVSISILTISFGPFLPNEMVTNLEISVIISVALTVLVLGQSLECETVLGTLLVWMIFCAFHLGKAVETTGLGSRVSLWLMSFMGLSLVGLGFAVFLSELVLAPFVPSNTARGGGIILPLVLGLTKSLRSTPTENSRAGRYLILCGAHANLLISSFFITACAPNPIVVGSAEKVLGISFSFASWTLGAIVPGVLSLAILPFAFIAITKPEYDGEVVVAESKKELQLIGKFSIPELKLVVIMIAALVMWVTGDLTNIPETFVAFLAFVALLLTKTLSWHDIASNSKAWDTFFWLSGMLVMAEQLSKLGVAKYIGGHAAAVIASITNSPVISALLLAFLYFISMIMFSSITGHAISLVPPFLAAGQHLGASPWLTTALLGYTSSLSATITPFSTGSIVLYFSQGFFTQTEWIVIGACVSGFYMIVYSTVGLLWWKILGFF